MEFNKIQFPDTWNKYSLDDVCSKITSGGTPSRTKPEFYENGSINWVKTKELNNYYIYDTEEKITEEALKKSSAKLLPTNTILLAMYGATVGELGILSKEMACNQACCALITNPKICDYRYLFYLLAFHKEEIINLATGAAQQNISAKIIRELTFRFPDIDQQKEIVDVLNTLDKKIQLNTQINQTLEQIAQTIFKSWFIDFDPVHAKANALANGQTAEQATQAAMAVISGKNLEELHRLQTANPEQYQQLWEIAEAFPSGVDEEGVPRGWEEKFFGELLENTIGGDWGKDEVDEKHTEKVSILRGTDLPDVYKGNDKDVPTRFVEQKKLKSRKLQYSDIVIEVSGGSKNQPTGRSLLITDKLLSRFNNPIVPASFCRLFRPKSENYGYLLALHLQIIYQQGKTWEYQNQSTGISNFQTTHFLETEKVILPTNKTLMYFAEMVSPIFDKIYSDENQRLAEIRDELLPKLLSGEVVV